MGQRSMGMSSASGRMMGSHAGNVRAGRLDGEPGSRSANQPRMGLQLGLGGRWWDDHHTMRKLKISPDQQRRMDTIFEANKPALLDLYTKYQQQEAGLASLSHTDLQDESKVFAAIDRVSQARGNLEKENAHMLLQIRQQLTPQQLQTLDREIAKPK
ncbi:MAG: periplasmic heavy metal sensor [Acidobacteriota bacterium]